MNLFPPEINADADFENLYIHVPFCSGKCDYCAFYSEGSDHSGMEAYTARILAQLEEYKDRLTGAGTLYLGGGTPTVLRADLLEKLLHTLRETMPRLQEISIECNPESLTEEKASILGTYVNRVSMGVQTFHPHLRTRIGRRGEVGQVRKAFALLHKNGLHNLNCDLIYALPGQTPQELQSDLEQALDLGIRHLSAYSLIVEETSKLHQRFAPDEQELNDQAFLLEEQVLRPFMKKHTLRRYEISNYAGEGFQCLHNENIWHGERYLGLGPAACSFDGTDRCTQISDLASWLAGEMPEYDRIERITRLGEIFFMGLRTIRGWAEGEFQRKTSSEIPSGFHKHFADLRREGLMQENALALTEKGLDYWNSIAELFI